MNTDQHTLCPHCKATFQVSDEQLSAANGKVRCGSCMEVFDALAYLLPNEDDDAASPQPVSQPAQKEPEPELVPEFDEDELIFEDSEEEKKAAKGGFFGDGDLSDSFLDLEKEGSDPAHAFTAEIAQHEMPVVDEATTAEEAWAKKMLEEDDEPSQPEESPTPTSPSAQPTQARRPSAPTKGREKAKSDQPQKINFYYDDTPMRPARGGFFKALIGLFSIALVIALAGQIAWFNYERLAKYPLAKQGFEFACSHIGCTVPELSDLNAIHSSNLVVRSHPLVADTLIIDVVLTNTASFPQEYPRLALYFSDINDKTIAQQIITPQQYLNSSEMHLKQMPSNEPIHVSLEIEDPGKGAVNYKIRFFPSKSTPKH